MVARQKAGRAVTDKAKRTASGRAAAPRTARGEETRRVLLEAATGLFAERGYHATTVPEIVRAAGVGHGTFYEYFGNRRDILLALTEQAAEASRRRPRLTGDDLAGRIRSEIYWYLSDRVEHFLISKIWHEAANFDQEIAAARRRDREQRTARVRKGIEAAGPRPDLDPAAAAAALTAMLEEFGHRWFIEGDGPGQQPEDVQVAADTLTAIWLSAIGLDDRA